MDTSFEDLPAGAEAGHHEGDGAGGMAAVEITPEQVAAGVQFLISKYKRKTPFTQYENFGNMQNNVCIDNYSSDF